MAGGTAHAASKSRGCARSASWWLQTAEMSAPQGPRTPQGTQLPALAGAAGGKGHLRTYDEDDAAAAASRPAAVGCSTTGWFTNRACSILSDEERFYRFSDLVNVNV